MCELRRKSALIVDKEEIPLDKKSNAHKSELVQIYYMV